MFRRWNISVSYTHLDVYKRQEQVNRKYYGDEDTERRMEIKNVIYKELEEEGGLRVERCV